MRGHLVKAHSFLINDPKLRTPNTHINECWMIHKPG